MLQNVYDYLLLISLFLIWLLILVNVVLVVGGFITYIKHNRSDGNRNIEEWPFVSVLIPAHNEALVIRETIKAVMNFSYKKSRYEIIVINDNSTDNTAQILETVKSAYQDRFLKIINTDDITGGKGKSNALNIGFANCKGEIIAVYDADNTPERHALSELVYSMNNDEKAGAVIGKFRCRNKNKNLFTKFINIEGLYFQWMAQAGRWQLFKLCTIPGTNFIIRRSILDNLGGWDTKAITEDTEISFRIYKMGYHIRFCPYSTTWEQEPETLAVWFRQRKRWVKGNYYVMFKNFKTLFDPNAGPVKFDLIYFMCIYVFFFFGSVISDTIFIMSISGVIETTIIGYSLLLWFMAYVLFILSVLVAVSAEKGELHFSNLMIILLMYFTYCKLWVIVALVGLYSFLKDIAFKRETIWYKTERF